MTALSLLKSSAIRSWIGSLNPKGTEKPRVPDSGVAYREIGEGVRRSESLPEHS